MIIHNGRVYTLNENNDIANAIAIKNGKIIEVGAERQIMNKYLADEYIDAKGRAVYPGFIDAHCHILGYGKSFLEVDLKNLSSWTECVNRVVEFSNVNKSDWIVGRGWDQNKWTTHNLPSKELLDKNFPDIPVFLVRVDGHAAIANSKAFQIAGINDKTNIPGGSIIFDKGLLIDNAIDLLRLKIPAMKQADIEKALVLANNNTTSFGLTTLCDAGSEISTFKTIEKLQDEGKIYSRIYGMLVPDIESFNFAQKEGVYNPKNKLIIRSLKIVADGALGSWGACLKKHYSDNPNLIGKMLYKPKQIDSIALLYSALGYQINTHSIGDSANSYVLKVYASLLEGVNDKRWRIEHAQIMDTSEFHYFKEFSILPSVQPTHAVSDMPWAVSRVGIDRINGGYAFQSLLKQNGMIALGTDFPVEDINPFKTFYAAVSRSYYDGKPIKELNQTEKLSRLDAIKGMTLWAAMACFMENSVGTIEKGKFADIIITDRDILTVKEADILKTLVVNTIINGKRVHSLE